MEFTPNYQNIVDAANNKKTDRIPLYEHIVNIPVMEKVLNKEFEGLGNGSEREKAEYYKNYCEFYKLLGYDTVSMEGCVTCTLPNGGALGNHTKGAIQSMEDYNKYPWGELEERYFNCFDMDFKLLRGAMPAGMKAIGGVGNGIFEIVQDLVGYEDLCYMKVDDEELYAMMFRKVGDILVSIWTRFLREYGDMFCVCRFGDDLGFKSDTLLAHNDVISHILPQYKRVVEQVHGAKKPFLLHSCGAIFDVMDNIISVAKINAKHSNEDVIAPFGKWIDMYGEKIGNFGGVDTDVVCGTQSDVSEYITNVYKVARAKNGGVALGSGNSIPVYANVDAYMNMNHTFRSLRGE